MINSTIRDEIKTLQDSMNIRRPFFMAVIGALDNNYLIQFKIISCWLLRTVAVTTRSELDENWAICTESKETKS